MKELYDIIKERSFKQGPTFTLVSGRKSTIYFDLKPTMLDPKGAWFLGTVLHGTVSALKAEYIAGLAMGAIPLVSVTAALSTMYEEPIKALFVRQGVKDHGTSKQIEGLIEGESLEGKKVVVVEDVTTTGGSAIQVVRILREQGALVSNVITVVDREEGAGENFAKEGIHLDFLFLKSQFGKE